MTETQFTEPPWEEDQGWRILDPEGNIVASGPPIVLEEKLFDFSGDD